MKTWFDLVDGQFDGVSSSQEFSPVPGIQKKFNNSSSYCFLSEKPKAPSYQSVSGRAGKKAELCLVLKIQAYSPYNTTSKETGDACSQTNPLSYSHAAGHQEPWIAGLEVTTGVAFIKLL